MDQQRLEKARKVMDSVPAEDIRAYGEGRMQDISDEGMMKMRLYRELTRMAQPGAQPMPADGSALPPEAPQPQPEPNPGLGAGPNVKPPDGGIPVPTENPEQPGFLDYSIDRIKDSYAGMAGFLAKTSALRNLTTGKPLDEQLDYAEQAGEWAEEGVKDMTGFKRMKPRNEFEKYGGAAAASVADPLNILLPGSITAKIFGGYLAGGFGEFGFDTGKELGGNAGAAAGAVLGGVAGSLTGSTGIRGTAMAFKGGSKAYNWMKGKLDPQYLEDETQKHAAARVVTLFDQAVEADPTILQKFEELMELERLIGRPLPRAALLDNKILESAIGSLASKNTVPSFQHEMKVQFDEARKALSEKQVEMFGQPAQAVGTISENMTPTIRTREYEASLRAARESVKEEIDQIDARIQSVSQMEDVNPEQVSKAIEALVDKKETAARKSVKPEYDEFYRLAGPGEFLEPDHVEELWRFVVKADRKDLFALLPQPSRKLLAVWEPKRVKDENGNVIETFKGATAEDVDSLKQAINKGLRKFKDPKDVAFLETLMKNLEEVVKEINPEAWAQLKKADTSYKNAVGIPFNSETLKAVDRTKYSQTIVPIITKNPEALRDFLRATGDEGKALASQSLAAQLYDKAYDTGRDMIDPAKAKKWAHRHRFILDEMPEFRDKYFGPASTQQLALQLAKEKSQLEASLVQARSQQILVGEGDKPRTIVNRMYGDPKYTEQLLSSYGRDRDTLQALRAFVLDDILTGENPMKAIANKENVIVFNRLFGPEYMKNVEGLAKVAKKLAHNPADKAIPPSTRPKDPFEQRMHFTLGNITSQMRQGVISYPQKVAQLLSKYLAGEAARKGDEVVARALLDNPAIAARLRTAMENAARGEPVNEKSWRKIFRDAGLDPFDLGITYAATGVRGGVLGGVTSGEQPKTPRENRQRTKLNRQ